jgi:hypothetical protein
MPVEFAWVWNAVAVAGKALPMTRPTCREGPPSGYLDGLDAALSHAPARRPTPTVRQQVPGTFEADLRESTHSQ